MVIPPPPRKAVATTRSTRMVEQRREIVDHASRVARRLRGSAYRTRFCCLAVEATPYRDTQSSSGTLFDASNRDSSGFSANTITARGSYSFKHHAAIGSVQPPLLTSQMLSRRTRGLDELTVSRTRFSWKTSFYLKTPC